MINHKPCIKEGHIICAPKDGFGEFHIDCGEAGEAIETALEQNGREGGAGAYENNPGLLGEGKQSGEGFVDKGTSGDKDIILFRQIGRAHV